MVFVFSIFEIPTEKYIYNIFRAHFIALAETSKLKLYVHFVLFYNIFIS